MTAIIDTVALLREFLLDNSTLATAVSNRIWGGEIPDDEFNSMPRDAILILPRSDMSSVSIPVIYDSPQLICYGETARSAWQVYRKLFNALQRIGLQSLGQNRLMQAYKGYGPSYDLEPEVGWPRVTCSFTCIWAENALP